MMSDEDWALTDYIVRWNDEDFIVCTVTLGQLMRIQHDSETHGLNRKWSSDEALHRQVSGDGPMYLCPLFRERKGAYRSGLWYTAADEPHRTAVLLIDVRKELVPDLPELTSPGELKRVIIRMFGGTISGCQFEDTR